MMDAFKTGEINFLSQLGEGDKIKLRSIWLTRVASTTAITPVTATAS